LSTGGEAVPRGRLRVSVSVAFGVRFIVPLVPEFLALYPEVELDLSLTDGVIDLVEERADVAIRSGVLRDSRSRPASSWRAAASSSPRRPISKSTVCRDAR
jgi:DNA-binding transcriptional LysR family regulator